MGIHSFTYISSRSYILRQDQVGRHTPTVMVLYSVRLGKPGFVTAQTELMMEGANFGFIGRRRTQPIRVSDRGRKEI